MLSLEESLKILKETRALVEGHFILSSGLHSPKYIQCAQLMSKPYKANKFCESLAEKIKNEFGYEIGKLLKKETIFSERVNNLFQLRRDFKIKKNTKVLIVEDVITTGKSSLECSKLVTSNNGIIVGYACLIDRSNGNSKIENKIVSQVKLNIPTFTDTNIPKELSSITPVKPGSRNL